MMNKISLGLSISSFVLILIMFVFGNINLNFNEEESIVLEQPIYQSDLDRELSDMKQNIVNLSYSKASKSELETVAQDISTIKKDYVTYTTYKRHADSVDWSFGKIHHSHPSYR